VSQAFDGNVQEVDLELVVRASCVASCLVMPIEVLSLLYKSGATSRPSVLPMRLMAACILEFV
jgi:hypothetical protein